MDWEDILFYAVIFGAWAFSLLFKKFQKKQQPGEKKGFTLRVLEFLAELKEAGEKERNHIGSRMDAQTPVELQPAPLTVKKEEAVAETAVSQSAWKRHAKSTAGPVVEEHYKKTAVLPKPSVTASRKKGVGRKFPKQKMRDAIVWSEILGTPVGLRDS
ncbi:MAG: hypothetical protein KAI75_10895 [Desulfobulbaceae bacterium]|nr:hypothetical protein [Desulfobulbaceae bacterium]